MKNKDGNFYSKKEGIIAAVRVHFTHICLFAQTAAQKKKLGVAL